MPRYQSINQFITHKAAQYTNSESSVIMSHFR